MSGLVKRVHVLVEGQSEEAFVGRILAPHLWSVDVHLTPTVIMTRRTRSGPDFRGGVNSWGQVARDLRLLLQDTSVVAVTTLLDYYGLPSETPGMSSRPAGSARAKAQHVEHAIDTALADARLQSNVALHEFEALLYTDPDTCGAYLGSDRLATTMEQAVATAGGPEMVNDDPSSAPSKRILAAYPSFKKTIDGPSLVEEIGIDKIRNACPHFNGWLSWLESLGQA